MLSQTVSGASAHPPCRPACAACCIAPSISSPIPGMPAGKPAGKPAGVPCVQLDESLRCKIFAHPNRPAVCGSLAPSHEMCGNTREQAMFYLQRLERLSAPVN